MPIGLTSSAKVIAPHHPPLPGLARFRDHTPVVVVDIDGGRCGLDWRVRGTTASGNLRLRRGALSKDRSRSNLVLDETEPEVLAQIE